MAKMTKAQVAKYDKINKRLDSARSTIYAFAPDNQTIWSDCFKLASNDAKEQWSDAYKAKNDFEWQMVNEGRGYWNTFGSFQPNMGLFA